jgi:PTH1 family peptidyl-tRNA hydrolase
MSMAGKWTQRFHGLVNPIQVYNESVLLVKPLTFVNQSGQCARAVCDYYRITPESLLVIVDDVSLPMEAIRIRRKGSSGNHGGLNSIINHLNTEDFPRIRIGIDRDRRQELANYVLSRFSPEDEKILVEILDVATEAVITWIQEGIESSMNKYNRRG